MLKINKSLCLSQKKNKATALKLTSSLKKKEIDIEILENVSLKDIGNGTVRRGSVICPCCGYTTPVAVVRKQFRNKKGGVTDSRLVCIVAKRSGQQGRFYSLPLDCDINALKKATDSLCSLKKNRYNDLNAIPDEFLPTPKGEKGSTLGLRLQGYGMSQWGDMFSARQLLTLLTFVELIHECAEKITDVDKDFKNAVLTCLGLAVDRIADRNSTLCRWIPQNQNVGYTFGRQALSMIWDYVEISVFDAGGGWTEIISDLIYTLRNSQIDGSIGTVALASATNHPLPNDSSACLFTDPPYYDAVPYSDLSDFFYVWLKRSIGSYMPEYFGNILTNKEDECIVDGEKGKNREYFESMMQKAMNEGRRILTPSGIGIVVFAHKSTQGWEAQLKAMLEAGWIFTASWPIDTERPGRLRAIESAALSSSIHLVCRPRENIDGSLMCDDIGDWRNILQQLPTRIHEWMPRLSEEGVVGADAIFACLGPALEIYSRYSRVEKANGEKVELREYLEQVWGAVAKEALNMIFQGAHTEGFEEDARLTAMWLWTLSTGSNDSAIVDSESTVDADEDGMGNIKGTGFSLEYDAARKIAQGLGAHLENLTSVIEIDGDQARLIPVAERVNSLFGKGSMVATPRKKKKENQMTLFEEFNKVEEQGWSLGDEKSSVGKTVLDRLHQAMILFGAGRADAMRRFLVEEGVGKDERFWRLAQAFSALYPSSTDEKRWVDGVLARKKSLGF